MSLQVFLYAQFRGIERFVSGTSENSSFADRSLWVSLLTETTPRDFLSERKLSPLLVGYAGGGSFLLLLPEPMIASPLRSAFTTISSLISWEVLRRTPDW